MMSTEDIIENFYLPETKSAPQAKLTALTLACQLAKDQVINIYTDVRYAFWVAQNFGMLWKQWGFKPHHDILYKKQKTGF